MIRTYGVRTVKPTGFSSLVVLLREVSSFTPQNCIVILLWSPFYSTHSAPRGGNRKTIVLFFYHSRKLQRKSESENQTSRTSISREELKGSREFGNTRAYFVQESSFIENQLKAISTFRTLRGDDVILSRFTNFPRAVSSWKD